MPNPLRRKPTPPPGRLWVISQPFAPASPEHDLPQVRVGDIYRSTDRLVQFVAEVGGLGTLLVDAGRDDGRATTMDIMLARAGAAYRPPSSGNAPDDGPIAV